MMIESVELKDYRNYENLHLDFSPGVNLLYGNNAQGKTNVLESIYVCCTTKSHRGSRDREIIRFGQEESHIKLNVRKKDISYRIDMHLKKNKPKGIAVNGIPIRKASELFGMINVVFFSPEDLNIIKNGPSERRRFIDLELCQLNKSYVHALIQYNKVVLQRNHLLKEISMRPESEETLDVWDEQLIKYGIEVIGYRRKFIGQLDRIIGEVHGKLSGKKENLIVEYEPDTEENDLQRTLKNNRETDIRLKTTSAGPHRDDLRFMVNGIDIRRFGSQGQQRTAALSLKLAEIELVKYLIQDYPVLLLDDVLSELDGSRQEHLLEEINHIQTMITCTGLEDFLNHKVNIDRIYRISEGMVTGEKE